MSSVAALGYSPDVVICCIGILVIFLNRRRPRRQLLYIPFGTTIAVLLWIALRSYSTGDIFGFWLFVALAALFVLGAKRLGAWLVSLERPQQNR